MNYYIFGTVGILGVYYGYKYGKSYFNQYIFNQVMSEMNKIQDNDDVLFKPIEKTKSALVLYKHGGKDHKVCVTYDQTKARGMLRKEVFLVRSIELEQENDQTDNQNNNQPNQNTEERIEITHKPGVPYLISPSDMGGEKIIVIKDNKIIHEYQKDDIPGYLLF